MIFRQQVQFTRMPAEFRLRSGVNRPGEVVATGPTEEEIRESRDRQISEQNEHVQSTLEALQFTVEEYEQRRQQSLSELQQIAVELAVMAASRVVHSELQRESLGVEEFVADTISRMALLENAKVRLHPDDLQSLKTRLIGKTTPWNEELITLVSDRAIERGGVRLETESGRVVLSDVVTRLAQIRSEWMENINDTQAERRSVSGNSGTVQRFPDRRETA